MKHLLPAAVACACVALLSMGRPATAGAEPLELRASAGLPRAGLLAGNAIGWRSVTIRAENDDFSFEAVGRTCVDVPAPSTPARTASVADACNLELAPALRRPLRFAAVWKAPALPGIGTYADVSLRTMRVAERDEADPRTRLGFDVSVVQPLGSLDALAGVSTPLGSAARPAAYAGVALPIAARGQLEVVADVARLEASGALDRTVSARFRYAQPRGPRLTAGLTRLLDDPHSAWRADVGIDWRY